MFEIEQNCVITLNRIVWNRYVFLHLAVYKQKTVLMINWIVWTRTVWHLTMCKQKTILILSWIVWNILSKWLNLALNDPKSIYSP